MFYMFKSVHESVGWVSVRVSVGVSVGGSVGVSVRVSAVKVMSE